MPAMPCPQCRQHVEVPADRKVLCPRCQVWVTGPASAAAEAPLPPPVSKQPAPAPVPVSGGSTVDQPSPADAPPALTNVYFPRRRGRGAPRSSTLIGALLVALSVLFVICALLAAVPPRDGAAPILAGSASTWWIAALLCWVLISLGQLRDAVLDDNASR